jgi:hypothetical protein
MISGAAWLLVGLVLVDPRHAEHPPTAYLTSGVRVIAASPTASADETRAERAPSTSEASARGGRPTLRADQHRRRR